MKYGKLLVLIFLTGIVFRVIFWCVGLKHLPIGSDEAILGLMAKHIWLGEFPLVTWVQPHGGTLEAYLNAPLYLIFKTGKLAVRLLPFIFSVCFLVMCYLIGKEYFGEKAGLITASLIAIPPVYLSIMGALGISMNFPALLGSAVIIYIVHRVIYGNLPASRKILLLIVMGFIGGITFWVHLIVICAFLSAFLLFFINDRLFFIRRNFWIFILSFIIGSSPLWVYNLNNDFATFRMVHSLGMPETLTKLKMCLTFTLPATWALHIPTYIDSSYFIKVGEVFAIPYAAICIILIVTAIVAISRRCACPSKSPAPSSGGRSDEDRQTRPQAGSRRAVASQDRGFYRRHLHGIWILLFFLVLDIAIFSRNSRTNACSTRYLALTFIALIPIIGAGLTEVLKKTKVLFLILLFSLIGFNLAGNIVLMRAWAEPNFAEKYISLPENDDLISFLEKENISYGYMHYWLSYPITFKTDERIRMSPAYDERFGRYVHPYLREVQSASSVAYIFHPDVGLKANWFEKELKRIGGGYREKEISAFTAFYDFRPPVSNLQPADKDGFTLSSNYGRNSLRFAIDSDHATRWGTASPQRPEMFFTVDMGKVQEICGAILYLDDFRHDFPRGLEVYVSCDGEDWKMVYDSPQVGGSLYWDENNPRIYTDEEYIRVIFKPLDARWVKFMQTGYDYRLDWSITEFEILKQK